MSTVDDQAVADQFGIRPHWIYRKTHPETLKILGIKESAIDAAIADGILPPPMPLTARGRACGWLGAQLIEVIKKRLDAAPQRQANPPRPVKKDASAKPKIKNKKRGRR